MREVKLNPDLCLSQVQPDQVQAFPHQQIQNEHSNSIIPILAITRQRLGLLEQLPTRRERFAKVTERLWEIGDIVGVSWEAAQVRRSIWEKAMEWFSRKTSIAGIQLSNWILVLVALAVIWVIYSFVAH